MLAWMVYVVVVTTLLSAGAYAAERSAQLRQAPTRWLWGLSIIASLLIPTAISTLSIQIPSLTDTLDHAAPQKLIPLRQITAGVLAPSLWLFAATCRISTAPGLDLMLTWAWRLGSALIFVAIALNGLYLARRKRQWDQTTAAGARVFVSDDVGPAVVGLLRPRIVVPRWLTTASSAEQALVIAHEQSHLEANDAQLLAIAVLLIVTMPWNLPLWWQLRRLRFAIEVDCDARVLRRGHDVSDYGATLIMVGERQSNALTVVAAMSESKSFLEQRIRKMLSKRKKVAWASATALAALGFVLVASAAEVSPPNTGTGPGAYQTVAVAPQVLARYVGTYRFGQGAVFTVTRDGDQLSAKLVGQGAYPIYPQSPTEFFYKIVNAQLTFVTDGQNPATSVILHQNGADITGPRINAATAQQILDHTHALQARRTPSPGTEAAIRKMINGALTGDQPYASMTPELATAVRKQAPVMEAAAKSLGPIQSMQFLGVDDAGNDVYVVHQQNGVTHWLISVNSGGIITTALVRSGL